MVKYVANMHGNEVVGRELLLGLVEYLADSYKNGSDSEIRQLMSSMDIHILVCFIYIFLLQVHPQASTGCLTLKCVFLIWL